MVNLSKFNNSWYSPGAPAWVQAAWFFLGLPLVRSALNPSSALRRILLRAFGASLGAGVVLKPGLRVKYPWRLSVGDHSWFGEDCWIDNVADVSIGSSCCISQGAYLCTGNHDWSDPGFGLVVKPIKLRDGAWVGAKAVICPGVELGECAIAAAGSVVSKDVPAYEIHAGNPATFVRRRVFKLGPAAPSEVQPVAHCVSNPMLVRKHKRVILSAFLAMALSLVGTETVLRIGWGFGKPALSYRDPDFGYAFKPGQSLRRFGNRIYYNAEGLRSEPIRPQKPDYCIRILCIGDSVTNGGALTDQSETYPYMIRALLLGAGIESEVLNASAGAWGVENELAFVRKKGTFGSDFAVLQIGTHDLWQRKSRGDIVGNDPSFPEHPPVSAITEVLTRYLKPRVLSRVERGDPTIPASALREEDRLRCLHAIREMIQFVRSRGADPLVLLTPGLNELSAPELYRSGREGLLNLGAEMHVSIIDMLPKMRVAALKGMSPFRDGVHPNLTGNKSMAEQVATHILQTIKPIH